MINLSFDVPRESIFSEDTTDRILKKLVYHDLDRKFSNIHSKSIDIDKAEIKKVKNECVTVYLHSSDISNEIKGEPLVFSSDDINVSASSNVKVTPILC